MGRRALSGRTTSSGAIPHAWSLGVILPSGFSFSLSVAGCDRGLTDVKSVALADEMAAAGRVLRASDVKLRIEWRDPALQHGRRTRERGEERQPEENAEMTQTWTAECLVCGQRMVGATRAAAARALEQHTRATHHRGWLMLESSEDVRRLSTPRARKRGRGNLRVVLSVLMAGAIGIATPAQALSEGDSGGA